MTRADNLIETRISPDILNTIGKSFKFRHGKGIAEWLKNSLDNYLRLRHAGSEPMDGSWPVLIDLIDGTSTNNGPNLAVVDFGGTTLSAIENFFLYWGDSTAATHGGAAVTEVTGGHGNGGKFYMREMWRGGARFLTWRDGATTSLIVEKRQDDKTGRWELKNQPMTWREAARMALPEQEGLRGTDWLIAYLETEMPNLVRELDEKQRGLTIVVGRKAVQTTSANDVVRSGGRWDAQRLVDDILDAPQARRPIRELKISIFVNGALQVPLVMPPEIPSDPEWPDQEIDLSASVIPDRNLLQGASVGGHLRIMKTSVQLKGRLKDYNAVFVIDRKGNPIASHPIKELPVPGTSPILPFLHAELQLTFSDVDQLIQNDRERLVPSPTSDAILDWVSQCIWERVQSIEEKQRKEARNTELQRALPLNRELNAHAQRFLKEVQSQIFVDLVPDPTGGGAGQGGDGWGPIGDGVRGQGLRANGVGGGSGQGGTKEVPGKAQPSRQPQFPQILLSDIDPNPADPEGRSKHFTDRHPPLEQDDDDKQYNIWWINTSHPYAQVALAHGGARGMPFKTHQLYMFRDVVQREALRYRQRRDAELGLDIVENDLSEVSNQFLAELPHYLIEDLLG